MDQKVRDGEFSKIKLLFTKQRRDLLVCRHGQNINTYLGIVISNIGSFKGGVTGR